MYSKCGTVHCYNIISAINYGQEMQSMHIDPSYIRYSEYIEVYFWGVTINLLYLSSKLLTALQVRNSETSANWGLSIVHTHQGSWSVSKGVGGMYLCDLWLYSISHWCFVFIVKFASKNLIMIYTFFRPMCSWSPLWWQSTWTILYSHMHDNTKGLVLSLSTTVKITALSITHSINIH